MKLKDVIVPYGEPIPTRSADSILSALFRQILAELDIGKGNFLVRIDRYVRKNTTPEDAKEISSIRGNLAKELLRSVMTWKVFIKGLKVFNIQKFDIGINVEVFREPGDEGPATASVMRRVFLDPTLPKETRDISKTDNVVSVIFHDLMFALQIDTRHFMNLIADYIVKSDVPINTSEVSSARGNLKKELFKSSITWKVFIKGLMFIRVKRFEIGLYLYHQSGKMTFHGHKIHLDNSYDTPELDD